MVIQLGELVSGLALGEVVGSLLSDESEWLPAGAMRFGIASTTAAIISGISVLVKESVPQFHFINAGVNFFVELAFIFLVPLLIELVELVPLNFSYDELLLMDGLLVAESLILIFCKVY